MRLLFAPALGLLMLCACSSTLPPVTTPAQVAADLTGVVHTLMQIEPLIVLADPTAFTQAQKLAMANDLDNAQKTLATFSAGMPASQGASVAQQIDGYLNDAANTLAAMAPNIPALAKWSPALDAIDALLPVVEAFAGPSTIAGVPTRTLSMARGVRIHALTPDQARQALGIPVVHP